MSNGQAMTEPCTNELNGLQYGYEKPMVVAAKRSGITTFLDWWRATLYPSGTLPPNTSLKRWFLFTR